MIYFLLLLFATGKVRACIDEFSNFMIPSLRATYERSRWKGKSGKLVVQRNYHTQILCKTQNMKSKSRSQYRHWIVVTLTNTVRLSA